MISLSSKEEIQLKLEIVHNHAKREDEKHRADIKANVIHKWPATEDFIKSLQHY